MTWTAWAQSHLGIVPGWLAFNVAMVLLIALPVMLAVAMLIYADRKIWAAMALRKGPNVVGPFGLLQSFADGLKVFLQETIIPSSANKGLFLLAPIITFTVALIVWAVIPFDAGMALADINVGLLYILAASSLGVYGVMMAGWSSNSKYPFYSALRAAAQMVSYEVSIGFVLISVVLWAGSFNLSAIVEAQRSHLWITNGFGFNPLFFPMAVVFFISSLAETARAPFDLTEAESELVAGYQTEYSSMAFALFWLGEYANVILMAALNAILFWGGYLPPLDIPILYAVPGIIWLFIKILVFFFIFSWVKATVPRYRYDQLMRLGWKIFLPLSLIWVVLISGYLMLTRYAEAATPQTAQLGDASPDYTWRCTGYPTPREPKGMPITLDVGLVGKSPGFGTLVILKSDLLGYDVGKYKAAVHHAGFNVWMRDSSNQFNMDMPALDSLLTAFNIMKLVTYGDVSGGNVRYKGECVKL